MKNDNGQDWISFLFCKHCLIHNQKDNGTFGITISEDNQSDELVKIAGVILVHRNRMKVSQVDKVICYILFVGSSKML